MKCIFLNCLFKSWLEVTKLKHKLKTEVFWILKFINIPGTSWRIWRFLAASSQNWPNLAVCKVKSQIHWKMVRCKIVGGVKKITTCVLIGVWDDVYRQRQIICCNNGKWLKKGYLEIVRKNNKSLEVFIHLLRVNKQQQQQM